MKGTRMNDQNVPMSQAECCPRYFYHPHMLYHSYPLPNYLSFNAMLIGPYCPWTLCIFITSPFLLLSTGRETYTFHTSQNPHQNTNYHVSFKRSLIPHGDQGSHLPAKCIISDNSTSWPNNVMGGRGSFFILWPKSSTNFWKFIHKIHNQALQLYVHIQGKKVKLKEILALVDSISHNNNLLGVSTQLWGSGSAGKAAS